MMNNFDISRGFVKKEDIEKVLSDFQTSAMFTLEMVNAKAIVKAKNELKQQLYFKLSIIFKRQIQLDRNEALAFYNANVEVLKERLDLLYDIIEKINCDMKLVFIPDKLTIASFLRINADTFDFMLTDAQVIPETQKLFQELNEYILAMTTAGLENGVLNNYSFIRLQLKGKFGGNDLEVKKEAEKPQAILITSDIQRKLTADYNFTAMIDSKEKKEG